MTLSCCRYCIFLPHCLALAVFLIFICIQHGGSAPEKSDEESLLTDVLVLPPALVKVPEVNQGSRKHGHHQRRLENLIFRKKPIFEELLSENQRMVLEIADRTFSLKFNFLPVKRMVNLDASSGEEYLEVQAFELLSGIVGRAMRNSIICSTEQNSTTRQGRECTHIGMSIMQEEHDTPANSPDKLCNPDDPEAANSEECRQRKGRSGTLRNKERGPALENVVYVQNTGSKSPPVRLSPNGALGDAIDRQAWVKDNPTKFILSLVPFEFLKQRFAGEHVGSQISSALKTKYGSRNPHNIVEIHWPEIWPKRLSANQLANRYVSTAEEVSRLLLRWNRKELIKLDKLHIIGFSFGAHLAGVIAQMARESVGGAPTGRITGLDPLGWGFDEMDGLGLESQLDLTNDDALFVDIIHTSAPDSHFPFIHYGTNEKRGTVDFYQFCEMREHCKLHESKANNGRAPYCEPTDGLCHHFYSVILYAATIIDENFTGCKCSSWDDFIVRRKCTPCTESAKLGEHINQEEAKGVYYLVTA